MILYYVPGGCSLASHIALVEAGLDHRLVNVKQMERRELLAINPTGLTPALALDDGTLLTESLAILGHVAEQRGTLLPEAGLSRWRALEALSFMTTEVHGSFRVFFYPDATQAEKDRARAKLVARFSTLADQLGDRPFLVGDRMSLADLYLFVMLRWAAMFGIAVRERLDAYHARMTQVPSVARALAAEGLS
jgi:glutathione S-transferase